MHVSVHSDAQADRGREREREGETQREFIVSLKSTQGLVVKSILD